MVQNISSAVASPRIEVGKQITFYKEAKGVTPNSGSYRRTPQTQPVAARPPQFAVQPAPRASSSSAPIARNAELTRQNINKVALTGRLGRDAVIRQTKNDHVVANFSLGVDESYKDRLGEWQKKTSWHRVQVWGELAETIGADLQQGVQVYVEGRLVNHTWLDRENRKHHYTEVVAKEVRFQDPAPRPEARNGSEFTKEYGTELQ